MSGPPLAPPRSSRTKTGPTAMATHGTNSGNPPQQRKLSMLDESLKLFTNEEERKLDVYYAFVERIGAEKLKNFSQMEAEHFEMHLWMLASTLRNERLIQSFINRRAVRAYCARMKCIQRTIRTHIARRNFFLSRALRAYLLLTPAPTLTEPLDLDLLLLVLLEHFDQFRQGYLRPKIKRVVDREREAKLAALSEYNSFYRALSVSIGEEVRGKPRQPDDGSSSVGSPVFPKRKSLGDRSEQPQREGGGNGNNGDGELATNDSFAMVTKTFEEDPSALAVSTELSLLRTLFAGHWSTQGLSDPHRLLSGSNTSPTTGSGRQEQLSGEPSALLRQLLSEKHQEVYAAVLMIHRRYKDRLQSMFFEDCNRVISLSLERASALSKRAELMKRNSSSLHGSFHSLPPPGKGESEAHAERSATTKTTAEGEEDDMEDGEKLPPTRFGTVRYLVHKDVNAPSTDPTGASPTGTTANSNTTALLFSKPPEALELQLPAWTLQSAVFSKARKVRGVADMRAQRAIEESLQPPSDAPSVTGDEVTATASPDKVLRRQSTSTATGKMAVQKPGRGKRLQSLHAYEADALRELIGQGERKQHLIRGLREVRKTQEQETLRKQKYLLSTEAGLSSPRSPTSSSRTGSALGSPTKKGSRANSPTAIGGRRTGSRGGSPSHRGGGGGPGGSFGFGPGSPPLSPKGMLGKQGSIFCNASFGSAPFSNSSFGLRSNSACSSHSLGGSDESSEGEKEKRKRTSVATSPGKDKTRRKTRFQLPDGTEEEPEPVSIPYSHHGRPLSRAGTFGGSFVSYKPVSQYAEQAKNRRRTATIRDKELQQFIYRNSGGLPETAEQQKERVRKQLEDPANSEEAREWQLWQEASKVVLPPPAGVPEEVKHDRERRLSQARQAVEDEEQEYERRKNSVSARFFKDIVSAPYSSWAPEDVVSHIVEERFYSEHGGGPQSSLAALVTAKLAAKKLYAKGEARNKLMAPSPHTGRRTTIALEALKMHRNVQQRSRKSLDASTRRRGVRLEEDESVTDGLIERLVQGKMETAGLSVKPLCESQSAFGQNKLRLLPTSNEEAQHAGIAEIVLLRKRFSPSGVAQTKASTAGYSGSLSEVIRQRSAVTLALPEVTESFKHLMKKDASKYAVSVEGLVHKGEETLVNEVDGLMDELRETTKKLSGMCSASRSSTGHTTSVLQQRQQHHGQQQAPSLTSPSERSISSLPTSSASAVPTPRQFATAGVSATGTGTGAGSSTGTRTPPNILQPKINRSPSPASDFLLPPPQEQQCRPPEAEQKTPSASPGTRSPSRRKRPQSALFIASLRNRNRPLSQGMKASPVAPGGQETTDSHNTKAAEPASSNASFATATTTTTGTGTGRGPKAFRYDEQGYWSRKREKEERKETQASAEVDEGGAIKDATLTSHEPPLPTVSKEEEEFVFEYLQHTTAKATGAAQRRWKEAGKTKQG